MTTRFTPKDPAEQVVIGFDYSKLGTPSAPDVTVVVLSGDDPAPDNIKQAAATIDGTWVLQPVHGGIDGVEYGLRCLASVTGRHGKLLIDGILQVRARPTSRAI